MKRTKTIIVTVRIPNADIERVREVERTHAHLQAQVKEALKKRGCISRRSLYQGTEILDIDEWESEQGLRAFLQEMGPVIRELAAARGIGTPSGTIWRVY